MGPYISINHGVREDLGQDPKRCVTSKSKRSVDSRLGLFMAGLQICWQYLPATQIYILQHGGRVFVAFVEPPGKTFHSNFENTLWNEDSKERPDDTKAQSQVAGYSATVSIGLEMPS